MDLDQEETALPSFTKLSAFVVRMTRMNIPDFGDDPDPHPDSGSVVFGKLYAKSIRSISMKFGGHFRYDQRTNRLDFIDDPGKYTMCTLHSKMTPQVMEGGQYTMCITRNL